MSERKKKTLPSSYSLIYWSTPLFHSVIETVISFIFQSSCLLSLLLPPTHLYQESYTPTTLIIHSFIVCLSVSHFSFSSVALLLSFCLWSLSTLRLFPNSCVVAFFNDENKLTREKTIILYFLWKFLFPLPHIILK